MRKKNQDSGARSRVLVLVDESNVGSSVRTAGRGLDWLKLRDFLAGPNTGRDLIEMVVYSGLPPAIPTWQDERDRKNKFVHWLRSNGFMAVTKDGAPAEEGHYKANVDVMMAIDAVELSTQMQPDVIILVTGDADFGYLALQLRRRGIRVEVASVAQNLASALKRAAYLFGFTACLAALLSFLCLAALLAFACFCAACLFLVFGDLSPIYGGHSQ